MIEKNIRFLVLGLIAFLFIQCSSDPEISQWRGPNRDGIYPAKNLSKEWPTDGPELLWKFEELGIGHSSAAVISDKVYTSGTLEDSITYVFSFDLDGNFLWKKPLGKEWMTSFPGSHSTPLVYDEYIYQMTALGVVYCLSSESGDKIWERDVLKEFDGKNIMHGMTESLLVDGEKLFCSAGGEKSNVIALNRFTGETIWETEASKQVSSDCSPILVNHLDKKYFINAMANSVVAIDTENGELAWTYPLNYEWKFHASSPIYKDGKLFVIDGFGAGNFLLDIADDFSSVKKLWSDTTLEDYLTAAVLLDGRIYGSARYKIDKWYCYDFETGQKLFSNPIMNPGSIIYADGMFYCYAFNGQLGLVNAANDKFDLVSSIQIGTKRPDHWAPVVIKDGRMYVRYSKSIFVYNIKK